jgi:hypothetical protein
MADFAAATAFLAGHGRVLDRRRLGLLLGHGHPAGVLAALDGYHNPDGGYGWGIEPDLRAPESQPTGGMHAFEVLAELPPDPAVTARALQLCDWLDACTRPDGGLPFTLPVADPAGTAALWLGTDHTTSSLQMTAQVAATAHLVVRRHPAVADHPWLARATAWCVDRIRSLDDRVAAHELLFAVRFVDAYAADHDASDLLERLARHIPPDGIVPVEGGAADEALRPLDLAPRADGAARQLFADGIVAADLDRLAREQQPDGGWVVDFESASPAAALEWRGYATVAAVAVLQGEATRRP